MELNAIVTGAGRHKGIGAQIACALARNGINVYFTSNMQYDTKLASISKYEYEQTLQYCKQQGIRAFYQSFDLSSLDQVVQLFDDAQECMGNINILINCMCYHTFDSLGSITDDDIRKAFDANAVAPFLMCQEFYKRFDSEYGRIVNFSSTQNVECLTNEIAYGLTKASIPVMVYTLAPIMAQKGITINAVNPGATNIGVKNDVNLEKYEKSNIFGRVGSTEDSINLVEFLVSNKAKWITGQTINSEGAIYRGPTIF